MEIELKYKIDNVEQFERILANEWITSITENAKPEVVQMKAAYFDTEDLTLVKHNIAFRIRSEGERTIATLKWRDIDDGISGLYIRSEINIPVTDPINYSNPDPNVFIESAEGKDLIEIIDKKPLVNIFDMLFIRRRTRIDYEQSIIELSFDEGNIIVGSESIPLCELELEIFSGNKEDLLAIGRKIAREYKLKTELKTKFARGVELLKEQRGKGNVF